MPPPNHTDDKQKPGATFQDRMDAVRKILAESDFYVILDVERTCLQIEIRRAYISKSRLIHPDKLRNNDESTKAFQKIASAYETLYDPQRREEYDLYGKRYHSMNSEATLSNALAQIFTEFMQGEFENLLQIVEFINTQNPDIAISRDSAKQFFAQVHDVVVVAGRYCSVAKFEIMKLYEIQQQLRRLSYFDVLGRLRLTIRMTRIFLSIPVALNRHVTERQIMNEGFENVLDGVAGWLEHSEKSIGWVKGWVGSKRTSWWGF